MAGSHGSSIFSCFFFFKETSYCFPQWLHQFTYPQTIYEGFLFSTSSSIIVICVLFDYNHFERCEVIAYCGFNFHFLKLLL